MRERDLVRVNATLWRDLLKGKDKVNELVVLVEKLWFLGLGLGIAPFDERVNGFLHSFWGNPSHQRR